MHGACTTHAQRLHLVAGGRLADEGGAEGRFRGPACLVACASICRPSSKKHVAARRLSGRYATRRRGTPVKGRRLGPGPGPTTRRPWGGMAMTALVRLEGVSKSFAGVRVLKDVDFDVQPGEVHALLGENGAGKSTLIKIIAGAHAPDSGTIRIGDEALKAVTPRDAAARRHRHRLPGAAALPRADRRRERLPRPRARSSGCGRLDWAQMRRRSRAAARFARQPRPRRRRQGRHALGRQPPARRDRQGAEPERPRPDHGRADRGAGRRRRPAADGGDQAPARARRRHHLRQPQAAGDLRARRPGDGAARRRADRHPRRSPRSTSRRWSR